MNEQHKSTKYLDSSYRAFLEGDTDFAIRSLNISFNHVTNTDWTPVDVQRILRSLSWLYFYQGRYNKVAEQLELAVKHYRQSTKPDKRTLSYLYYNLAECYRRQSRAELCRVNFLTALDLLEAALGVEHHSFILLQERYLEVCVRPTEFVHWTDPKESTQSNNDLNLSSQKSGRKSELLAVAAI